jgi:hypothetical protein
MRFDETVNEKKMFSLYETRARRRTSDDEKKKSIGDH